VQSTRARIVELLRVAEGATVEEITNQLALAPATVRRHLDVLLRDGLVEMRSERVPLGRPHFVFTLTEAGLEALPRHQLHLIAAVLDTILALTPADTSGRSGKQIASMVFDRLAELLVSRCQPVVTSPELHRRLEQAVEVLVDAGLDFELTDCDEGYIVQGGVCPCVRLLSDARECVHEVDLLSELIGASVQPIEESESQRSHAYLVRSGEARVL
jgi:predicted ArsR family transcriptional regulator